MGLDGAGDDGRRAAPPGGGDPAAGGPATGDSATGDSATGDSTFGSEQPVDLEASGPSPAGPESAGPDSTGPDPGAGAAAAQRVRTWLRGIRPRRADLKADAMAGLPGAISSVPDGMATAVLVGVNPAYGL
ncbi:MAG TPA: hypothetical protein VFC16_09965 [Nakamurella sp.]|nr:hypothetical protein [Nakamurella sp.]